MNKVIYKVGDTMKTKYLKVLGMHFKCMQICKILNTWEIYKENTDAWIYFVKTESLVKNLKHNIHFNLTGEFID